MLLMLYHPVTGVQHTHLLLAKNRSHMMAHRHLPKERNGVLLLHLQIMGILFSIILTLILTHLFTVTYSPLQDNSDDTSALSCNTEKDKGRLNHRSAGRLSIVNISDVVNVNSYSRSKLIQGALVLHSPFPK